MTEDECEKKKNVHNAPRRFHVFGHLRPIHDPWRLGLHSDTVSATMRMDGTFLGEDWDEGVDIKVLQ